MVEEHGDGVNKPSQDKKKMCKHKNLQPYGIASRIVNIITIGFYGLEGYCGPIYSQVRKCVDCGQRQVLDKRWKNIENTDWFGWNF